MLEFKKRGASEAGNVYDVLFPGGIRMKDLEPLLRMARGRDETGHIYLSFSPLLPTVSEYDAMFSYSLDKDGAMPESLADKLPSAIMAMGAWGEMDYFISACEYEHGKAAPYEPDMELFAKSRSEKLKAYESIGTVEQVRQACAKQEAMPVLMRPSKKDLGKPLKEGMFVYYGCPRCRFFFGNGFYYPPLMHESDKPYCMRCGQRLAWDGKGYDPGQVQDWLAGE